MSIKKKLTGINRLLKTIGEPPLLNEDDFQLSYEADLADRQLEETKKTILTMGYAFNTVEAVVLSPDINGYIGVPPSALSIIPSDKNIVVREGLLFDKEAITFNFTESKTVKIVYDSDFDYMPSELAELIMAKSAYIFQRDNINDPSVNQELLREVQEAQKNVNIWHIRETKASGLNANFSRKVNPKGSF